MLLIGWHIDFVLCVTLFESYLHLTYGKGEGKIACIDNVMVNKMV